MGTWIGFNEGVEVARYTNEAEATAALARREVQSVAPIQGKAAEREPATPGVRYVTKTTSELRVGDVVVEHGMRCLIDREIQVSKSHPVASDGSVCRFTQALVLNRDDEATRAVPVSWTADWKRNSREPVPHDGEHRWTIQGNDLARWHVESERYIALGGGNPHTLDGWYPVGGETV
jgi:hypothetical protein